MPSHSSCSTRVIIRSIAVGSVALFALLALIASPVGSIAQRTHDLGDSAESQQRSIRDATAVQDRATPRELFRDGNYAMFIHWGLYSEYAGKWRGDTYYGIVEWIMNHNMAGIPRAEYMASAARFNPADFDAAAIVDLAKAAGMKYIVITSKHHDGFAMFDSKHPFNIVDTTPFGRDPMRELAEECQKAGLGFGFYYSHRQDWTAPGGGGGPGKHEDGSRATFDEYFRTKCYPQVEEICTGYGPLTIVWFDTPGKMPKKYSVALRDLVRRTQPNALLGSRIGHGMGDYVSKGDMEVPPKNLEGMWETVDTTNDSWSYAWYDSNWKSSREILGRLVGTVARGGTYMLNVGPTGKGVIPAPCQAFLRRSGDWVRRHPDVVYGAGPSPWGHGFPWGDVTTSSEDALSLCVFDWPRDGKLHLPGIQNSIVSAVLVGGESEVAIDTQASGSWITLSLPSAAPDPIASIIRLRTDGPIDVDETLAVAPNYPTKLEAHFADATDAEKKRIKWTEKFGEWKHQTQIGEWQPGGAVSWRVDVLEPGYYRVGLRYRGEGPLVWRLESSEGEAVQNQQGSTTKYATYPLGLLKFSNPGVHTVSVTLVDGERDSASLASVDLERIE